MRKRREAAGNRRVHEKYWRGAEFRRCYQPLTFTLSLSLLLSLSLSLSRSLSAERRNERQLDDGIARLRESGLIRESLVSSAKSGDQVEGSSTRLRIRREGNVERGRSWRRYRGGNARCNWLIMADSLISRTACHGKIDFAKVWWYRCWHETWCGKAGRKYFAIRAVADLTLRAWT